MGKALETLEKTIQHSTACFNDTAGVAILYPLLLMREIEELLPSLELTFEYKNKGLSKMGFEIGYVKKNGMWSKTNTTLLRLEPMDNSAAKGMIKINKDTEYFSKLEETVKKVNNDVGLPENIGYCLKPENFSSYELYEDGLKSER